MEPRVDIDDVKRNAQRHWMEDGLSEILVGLLFIIIGGGLLLKLALPRWLTLDLLSSALTAAGALGLSWGFKKLKERITLPRSGYVVLPEPTRTRRMLTFGSVAVLGLASALGLLTHVVVVPVVAAVFAMCFLWGGVQYKQTSMLWEAFLTLLFAVVSTRFTSLSGVAGVLALMVMIGTSMAILGAVRLRGFLKANPRPQETEA
ncbi:MAG TPA: hypothetical protein VGQ49_02860 [Bryobacteraceae bacterium]|jgi:hypothetical protein|nr:hypothetical protein [Bryobacteraceae bacterium]